MKWGIAYNKEENGIIKFAYRPIKLDDGRYIWLEKYLKRKYINPIWPYNSYWIIEELKEKINE
jgi:hypothetical protein